MTQRLFSAFRRAHHRVVIVFRDHAARQFGHAHIGGHLAVSRHHVDKLFHPLGQGAFARGASAHRLPQLIPAAAAYRRAFGKIKAAELHERGSERDILAEVVCHAQQIHQTVDIDIAVLARQSARVQRYAQVAQRFQYFRHAALGGAGEQHDIAVIHGRDLAVLALYLDVLDQIIYAVGDIASLGLCRCRAHAFGVRAHAVSVLELKRKNLFFIFFEQRQTHRGLHLAFHDEFAVFFVIESAAVFCHEPTEDLVDELQYPRVRAEIPVQLDRFPALASAELVVFFQKDGGVGVAESIYALLGVAHHEKILPLARERLQKPLLNVVDVLIFVHAHIVVTLRHHLGYRGVVEQLAGILLQIVEIQLVLPALFLRVSRRDVQRKAREREHEFARAVHARPLFRLRMRKHCGALCQLLFITVAQIFIRFEQLARIRLFFLFVDARRGGKTYVQRVHVVISLDLAHSPYHRRVRQKAFAMPVQFAFEPFFQIAYLFQRLLANRAEFLDKKPHRIALVERQIIFPHPFVLQFIQPVMIGAGAAVKGADIFFERLSAAQKLRKLIDFHVPFFRRL